jgi:hypothetical protein
MLQMSLSGSSEANAILSPAAFAALFVVGFAMMILSSVALAMFCRKHNDRHATTALTRLLAYIKLCCQII